MIELLSEAVSWNRGWFFGSATTAFGLPFLAQKIAKEFFKKDMSVNWSLAIGGLIFAAAIIARFISLVNERLTPNEANSVNWYFAIGGLIFLTVIIVYLLLFIREKLTKIEISNANEIKERDSIIVKLQEEKNQRKSAEVLLTNQHKPFNRSANNYYIYGEGVLILKDGFARMHAIKRNNNTDGQQVADGMKFLCGRIKKVFEEGTEKINGKKYAVSIKLFNPRDITDSFENRELIFKFGDSISSKARSAHYAKRSKLSESTCYEHSYIPDADFFYYINNDVPSDTSYVSAFADTYSFPHGVMSAEERAAKWSVPYRSELVIPLHPVQANDGFSYQKEKIIGFLCVDCTEINGFHPKYDVGLLQGVADGIYDLIVQWYQSKAQTNVDLIG